MKYITSICFIIIFIFLFSGSIWGLENIEDNISEYLLEFSESHEVIHSGLQRLLMAYPDFLVSANSNMLEWVDGTRILFDDGIEDKDFEILLNYPDLEDQLKMIYPKGKKYFIPERNYDPGRIRYEPFFLKMYGNSPEEVHRNLVPISWLPSTVNRTLMITSINGVNQKLQAVSDELDGMPHLHKYVDNPAGTFNWRRIDGTKRLSSHSFGIAIDVNLKYSNYWSWDDPKKEQFYLGYVNRIPMEIVEIFEKHGFIWGGKWFHYDTMHFEYRPELLIDNLEFELILSNDDQIPL